MFEVLVGELCTELFEWLEVGSLTALRRVNRSLRNQVDQLTSNHLLRKHLIEGRPLVWKHLIEGRPFKDDRRTAYLPLFILTNFQSSLTRKLLFQAWKLRHFHSQSTIVEKAWDFYLRNFIEEDQQGSIATTLDELFAGVHAVHLQLDSRSFEQVQLHLQVIGRYPSLNNLRSLQLINAGLKYYPLVLHNLMRLEKLDLTGNQLEELPPSSWKIETLILDGNPLVFERMLPYTGLGSPHDQRISLRHCNLTSLASFLKVYSPGYLVKLDVSHNYLESLELKSSTMVKHLNASHNRLRKVTLNYDLASLNLSYNQLKKVKLQRVYQKVNLSRNPLVSWSIKRTASLNLSFTELEDIQLPTSYLDTEEKLELFLDNEQFLINGEEQVHLTYLEDDLIEEVTSEEE